MNRLLLFSCVLAAVAVIGCGTTTQESSDEEATATAAPSPIVIPTIQRAASPATTPTAALIDRLKADLSSLTGAAVADITVVSLTTLNWPDGCLGLGGPGVVCTQALVPGWLAILRIPGGREYRYRGAGDRFAIEP